MADAILEGSYTGTALAEQTPLQNEDADSNVAWQRVGPRTGRKSLGRPLQNSVQEANSMQKAAPPIQNKDGERAIQGNEVVPGLTIMVGNLPPGCTHKSLKFFAIEADTAPLWAVVYSRRDARTGALGFKTAQEAIRAASKLHGALFQGIPVHAAPWNIDQLNYARSCACKHGRQCRGKGTYCIFGHASSVCSPE